MTDLAMLARRLLPVVRADSREAARVKVDELVAAGFGAVEVTFTVPDAAALLLELRDHHPELLLGAGTVLAAEQARSAVAAGARFVVGPGFSADVLRACREQQCLYVPGVFTPSEVANARDLGLRLVKLFPAARLGPSYLADLRGPFPDMHFLPTGGIEPAAVTDWIAAGAFAIGLGGSLFRGGVATAMTTLAAPLEASSWRT